MLSGVLSLYDNCAARFRAIQDNYMSNKHSGCQCQEKLWEIVIIWAFWVTLLLSEDSAILPIGVMNCFVTAGQPWARCKGTAVQGGSEESACLETPLNVSLHCTNAALEQPKDNYAKLLYLRTLKSTPKMWPKLAHSGSTWAGRAPNGKHWWRACQLKAWCGSLAAWPQK